MTAADDRRSGAATLLRTTGSGRPGRPRALFGRDTEIEALAAPRRGLHVLRGARGSGRSAVLDQVALRAGTAGRTVLRVRAGEAEPWDRYGAGALLDAVRSAFEVLDGSPALARAVAALDRACAPSTREGPDGRSATVLALARLVHVLRGRGELVVLVDDADALAVPFTAPGAAATAGHLVVAAVRDTCPSGETLELVRNAERVVDLPALAEPDVARLLARHVRRPLAPSAHDAVAAALGDLAGNPAAVLGAVDELLDRGRLVDVHGYLAPAAPDVPVLLPAAHPTVTAVEELGAAAALVLLVASRTEFTIDTLPVLAEATGHPTTEYGAAVDGLVGLGVLRGHDRHLAVTSPAVAASVVERLGHARAARLHADLVRAQACAARPVVFSQAALADHVVAAGEALAPDPSLTPVLAATAARAERRDPDRATARWTAARRHAAADERPAITVRFRQHLQRTGSYAELAALVAELARDATPHGHDRAELAALGGLAALHLGVDAAPDVRAALEDDAGGACPFGLHDRWSAAISSVSADDVAAAFRALPECGAPASAGPEDPADAGGRYALDLEEGVALRDLVPVFATLFPRSYGAPSRGPAAHHHRIVLGYSSGRWSDALTAAREMAAGGAGDVLTRESASLVTAEILAWRGDDRASRQWVATVRPESPFAVARAWIEQAMLSGRPTDDTESDDAPLVAGHRLYLGARTRPWTGRAWRLLVRLSVLALVHGLPDWQAWLLAEARSLRERPLNRTSALYAAALEPLLHHDAAGAAAAIDGLRAYDRNFDVALLCLGAGAVAGDPEPWLLESRAFAAAAGAERLLRRIRIVMAERGVSAPRAAPNRLTSAEQELVALVRRGMTNRQIGSELHLSTKTVENTLTRLFAKLGCRTRYGLAALDLDPDGAAA